MTDQDNFLNGCLELETLLPPEELLEELNRIESEAGRERKVHWGTADTGSGYYFLDDLIVQETELCIPHVDMQRRSFVLEPLCTDRAL